MAKPKGCKDTDMGMNDIRKNIEKLGHLAVKAGIIEGSGSVDGVDVAQYGAWNEYGVPGKKQKWDIPPRPFIRGFLENNSEAIKKKQEQLSRAVSSGVMDAERAIGLLGQFAQDGIKRYIRTGSFKENAETTIKRKKSSKPLVDTGTLVNSIRFEVTKR
jgi:hypothetical protein